MSSPSLQRFLDRLGTLQRGEDRYPVELVSSLGSADLHTAEEALIERVEHDDDAIAARSLAGLGTVRAVGPVRLLAERLGPGTPRELTWIAAMALGDNAAQTEVAAIVRGGTPTGRVAAMLAVTEHTTPVLIDAVLDALQAPEATVRGHAWDAWLACCGVGALVRPPRSPLDTLRLQLLAELPLVWQDAADRIRALTPPLLAGSDPAGLGLVYEPSTPDQARRQLARNLAGADKPLDMDLIASFSGHDRRWVEVLLALRCGPDHRDPRAPGALADLGATWTAAVLEQAVEHMTDDHPFAIAVARALPRLWA